MKFVSVAVAAGIVGIIAACSSSSSGTGSGSSGSTSSGSTSSSGSDTTYNDCLVAIGGDGRRPCTKESDCGVFLDGGPCGDAGEFEVQLCGNSFTCIVPTGKTSGTCISLGAIGACAKNADCTTGCCSNSFHYSDNSGSVAICVTQGSATCVPR